MIGELVGPNVRTYDRSKPLIFIHVPKTAGESVRDVFARWFPGKVFPQFLRSTPPNMLDHFPRPVTRDNYRQVIEECFIEVGLTERLAESLRRIASQLSLPFDPAWLAHRNATERTEPAPEELRAEYMKKHSLEFDVYEYAKRRFDERP